jgi:DNA-binding IclR family transcriptional regulator
VADREPVSTREGPVKVLSKAAAALSVLARMGELTAAELADHINEPRTSVYRILQALEENGLVEPGTRRGSFELGLRLFTLGSAVARRFNDERTAALPAMERLHDQTLQTIFLTVRREFEAFCVERLDGQQVGVMILPVGGTVPLHSGANARALLAFEPETFWDAFLAHRPLERFTDKTPTTRAALVKELRLIRDEGYGISDEDVIPHVASIAAPIFDHARRIRASISMSGPRPAVLGDSAQKNIGLVRDAAAEISRRLGSEAGNA